MTIENLTTPTPAANTAVTGAATPPTTDTPLTLHELYALRWETLGQLADAVQAFRTIEAAGFSLTGELGALNEWLGEREAQYVAAYQRWRTLLHSPYDAEVGAEEREKREGREGRDWRYVF